MSETHLGMALLELTCNSDAEGGGTKNVECQGRGAERGE
jgi:hypothetical protein